MSRIKNKHYADIGIQLFNPGIQHTVDELKEMCGNRLTLLHGIPPRDVLALGTPADVSAAVRRLLVETADHSRLILSCAGGMPPDVSTANLRAFIAAARRGNPQASLTIGGKMTPSTALGSCRYRVKNEEDHRKILSVLKNIASNPNGDNVRVYRTIKKRPPRFHA